MNKAWIGAAVVAGAMAFAGGASASSVTVSVPGTANPFLIGYPSGGSVTIFGYTDTVAEDAPVYAGAVHGGETVRFSDVTGGVANAPGLPLDGPDGGWLASTQGGPGIGRYYYLPINSLIGVFYDASAGAGPVTGPTTTLTPAVNQVFFIGEGSLGSYVVPTGATGLYLATVDAFQWSNNVGAFSVKVTAAPEPATWAMLLAGFAGLGFVGYRRARSAAAA